MRQRFGGLSVSLGQRRVNEDTSSALLSINIVFALAALVNAGSDTRMPTMMYAVATAIHLAGGVWQFKRNNYLVAVYTAVIASIALLAVAAELAPALTFTPYLTADVYSPENIARAHTVLLLAGCTFQIITLAAAPRTAWKWGDATPAEQRFARVFMSWSLLGAVILFPLTARGSLITSAAYASSEQLAGRGIVTASGADLIAMFLLSTALVASARYQGLWRLAHRLTFCLGLAEVVYFRILRGDRGGALIFVATSVVLFVQLTRRSSRQKFVGTAMAALITMAFFEYWGGIRAQAASMGMAEATTATVGERRDALMVDQGFDPLGLTLMPQSYWHLLHTIDLYDSGIRLNGESFVNLIPQAIPEDIAAAFGIERPMNIAWRLADYRLHGGGMFLIAEGYWNFGLFGACLIAALLAGVAVATERWFRNRPPVFAGWYFAFLGTVGYGLTYGLQAYARALEITIVLVFITALAYRSSERKYLREQFLRSNALQHLNVGA